MSSRMMIVRETRSDYAALPPLVVDASVMAAIVFDDEDSAEAAQGVTRHRLFAPSLIDYEIANVARNKVRRRLLSAGDAARAVEAFAALRLDRVHVSPQDAFATADRLGLTAYDAAYVHLAMSVNAPLATLDKALGQAARKLAAGGRLPPKE